MGNFDQNRFGILNKKHQNPISSILFGEDTGVITKSHFFRYYLRLKH